MSLRVVPWRLLVDVIRGAPAGTRAVQRGS
jgi:hypothetical protein